MTSILKGGNVDYILRSAISNISKFFSHGWGDIDILNRLRHFQNTVVLDHGKMLNEVYSKLENTEIKISKGKKLNDSMTIYKGEFMSPLNKFVPNALPAGCEKARFQVILPNNWKDKNKKPMCVHLAGTGDHFFWRRRYFMAVPLGKEHKIGSIILENPFYGQRKPKNQVASAVNHVSDIFVMGAALLVETVTLLLWCQRMNFGPLGITGISMGGHMASVAASGWFEPLALIPCLSWSSAAPCFTDGVLSRTIHWEVLERQLQDQPEYLKFIEELPEYKKCLMAHYKTGCAHIPAEDPTQNEISNSRYNQIYSSVSSVVSNVSNIKAWSYIDSQGKRLGSLVVEADVWKYIESLSKQIPNPVPSFAAYRLLNIETFIKETVWSSNSSNFQPSRETLDYMTAIMHENTHLSRFNTPHKDSSIIYVVADHDRYMPKECYQETPKDIWPESEIRTVNSGHVLAVLQHQNDFRNAIKDSFEVLLGL